MSTLIAYVEWDQDTGLYAGVVPDLRGVHTDGLTTEELHENLWEVLELCWKEQNLPRCDYPQNICQKQIEISNVVGLPNRIDFYTMNNVLLHLKFDQVRQKGCHVFYQNQDGKITTVVRGDAPFTNSLNVRATEVQRRFLSRPLVREILRDIDFTLEQFQKELGIN